MLRADGKLVWQAVAVKSRNGEQTRSRRTELIWRSPDAKLNRSYEKAEDVMNAHLNRLVTVLESLGKFNRLNDKA